MTRATKSWWSFLNRKHTARAQGRRSRPRLQVECLESRDLPAPLTWAAGASLPVARGGVVAVSQGDIFVLGGTTTNVTFLTATDPTWKAAVGPEPAVDTARFSSDAGIAPNGLYLIFGGRGNGSALSSADLYNVSGAPDSEPPINQSVSPMNSSRVLFGSATDENHHIYAIGGIGNNGGGGDGGGTDAPLSSVEYYDQPTDTWNLVASLPQTLYSEAAVADGAGHLFTFGGVDSSGAITSTVYRYTIASNTWDTVASMPLAVRDSAAVLGPNGTIYVLGGRTSTGATAAVESYNESTNTWVTESPLPAPVYGEAAAVDSLGRIEVLGGFNVNGKATAAVSISQELSNPDAAPAITSTANTSASWGDLYHYQVLSTANPQATYSLTSAPSGMTINSSTGLISWTPSVSQVGSFSVTVQASNSAGQTSQSYTGAVVAPSPTAPTGLIVDAAGGDSVALSWNGSTDPSGGISYGVYHVTAGAHHTTVYTLMGTTANTSITLTGLTPGYTYLLTVKATDAAGRSSGYSNYYNATTQAAPALYSLSGTSISGTAKHQINVHLAALGAPTLTYKMVAGPSSMTINATTGVVLWTPTDLDANTNPYAIFQVSNSTGTSGQLVIHFNVAPNLPVLHYTSPDLVGGTLYATPNSAFSMNLSDSFSHSVITWAILNGPSGLTINASTGVVSWTPASGTLLGPYTVTIQATNYAGSVTLTVPLTVTFATGPVSFTASNLNSTAGTADLSWSAPTSSAQTVTNYRIVVTYTDSSGNKQTRTIIVGGTSTSYTLTGLPSGTKYSVSIAALDAIGDLGTPSLVTFSL
jgi:N-acetylneuraminic acid mutarotase